MKWLIRLIIKGEIRYYQNLKLREGFDDMYVENEKIENLKQELQELLENYQNNKQLQVKLSALSTRLSDEVAKANNCKSINDKEHRQYQKQQKLLLNQIGVATTLQMNLTEHTHTLSNEEEQQVLAEINELYQQLFTVQDKKTFKQLHKKYLKLKQRLNEPQSFDYSNVNLNIRPRQITIESYNKQSIRAALRYLDVVDTEARVDIVQALKTINFSKKQVNVLNKWMSCDSLTNKETVHLKNAVDKIVYALNNENIYIMNKKI